MDETNPFMRILIEAQRIRELRQAERDVRVKFWQQEIRRQDEKGIKNARRAA